jgi:membrane associated rhomboid family serine protease
VTFEGTSTVVEPGRDADPSRFGTDAFYSAIGRAFVAMCAVVPMLFLIELLDRLTGDHLDVSGGIRPHHISGLDGIVLAPFLHASYSHVLSNSIPLILLGTFVLASGARRFLLTTLFIAVVSGLGVWFTGDPRSVVVGASGVIFGYLGVLLMRGIVERSWWHIAVGLLIGLLYGWQLIGVLPADGPVSWQAHLFGFVGGLVAAVLFRRRRSGRSRPAPTPVPVPLDAAS